MTTPLTAAATLRREDNARWLVAIATFAVAATVSFLAFLSPDTDAGMSRAVQPAGVRVVTLGPKATELSPAADAGTALPAGQTAGESLWCSSELLTDDALGLLRAFNICQP